MNTNPESDADKIQFLAGLIHRQDCYATQWANGQGYSCKKEELTDHILQQHLKGKITIGVYQLKPNDTVIWAVSDHDKGTPEDYAEAVKLFEYLKKEGYGVILEESGGAPYRTHVWLLLPKPTPAGQAKAFLESTCKVLGIRPHELFPKQTNLDISRPFGNLVKLPFGINRKSGVRSKIVGVANL